MGKLDCYFGYMSGGNLVVADMYVNGLVAPALDTSFGGQNSILASNGGISNGELTVFFCWILNFFSGNFNVILTLETLKMLCL
jgi:hypothetical protein